MGPLGARPSRAQDWHQGPPRKANPMFTRALCRAVPVAAMLLGAGAIAASTSFAAGGAGGGGGGGAVVVPGGEIVYNTASVTLSGFAGNTAMPLPVTPRGTLLASTTVTTDATGLANLNVAGIAAPEPLACWTGFTPDILPGDTINVGGTPVIAPDFSIDRPTQVGGDLVLHGT